jgi:tetratricopeptide (TPR) repeat protein
MRALANRVSGRKPNPARRELYDRIERAQISMQREDWQTACDEWAEVRRIRPKKLIGFIGGAEALRQAGRIEEADGVLTDALLRFPDELGVHLARVRLLLATGRDTSGIKAAQETASRFETSFDAQHSLAGALCRSGRWAEAATQYQMMIERFPGTPASPMHRKCVIYSRGILEANRFLPNISHATTLSVQPGKRSAGAASKRFLFISGVPRSGTSALGSLLNLSPNVALFVELFSPWFPYAPDSFNESVVNEAVRAKPLHGNPGRIEKARSTLYVGDKRPLFHCSLPQTLKNMTDHEVVIFHVLRPIRHVCLSYQRRAEDPDNWDVLRTVDQCVHEINVMNRFICEFEQEPLSARHRFLPVAYERVFTEPDHAQSLFSELELPTAGFQNEVEAFIKRSSPIVRKERRENASVDRAIADLLDFEAARKVERITGISLL